MIFPDSQSDNWSYILASRLEMFGKKIGCVCYNRMIQRLQIKSDNPGYKYQI